MKLSMKSSIISWRKKMVNVKNLKENDELFYGQSLLKFKGFNDKGHILLQDSDGEVFNLLPELVETHGKLV